MRKFIFMLVASWMALSMLSYAAGKKQNKQQPMPVAVSDFVTAKFPGDKIVKVSVDTEKGSKEYELKLMSGIKIKFDAAGAWREIDLKSTKMPAGVLPDTIFKYIEHHYPGRIITETSKTKAGYEIELDNDAELYFSSTGKFLRKEK